MAVLKSMLQPIAAVSRWRREASLRRLPCPERFHRMLDRERLRSAHSGEEFSLLSFEVRDGETGRAALAHLARLVQRRLRITDEAGWLDSRHLGVILPNTPGWGAWTVVDRLQSSLPGQISAPECTVYVYPSYWPWAGEGEPRQTGQAPR